MCYPRINSNDKEEGKRKLQQDLTLVADTKRCWNLKLNSVKCMVMGFGERSGNKCENYQVFGESLHLVYVYKDLSRYVVAKLSFYEQVTLVVSRASSMFSKLLIYILHCVTLC